MAHESFTFCPVCRTELIPMEHGGRHRPACPDAECGFVNWGNPIPVVAAIVQHEDQVILVRSHGWPDNYYGLVAGFVEAGEGIEDAVLREIKEEIGLETSEPTFLGSYPFDIRNQLLFVFHAHATTLDIRLDEEELASYKRVRIDQLVPWSRGTGLAVRDWLRSLGYEREPVEFGRHMPQSSNEKS